MGVSRLSTARLNRLLGNTRGAPSIYRWAAPCGCVSGALLRRGALFTWVGCRPGVPREASRVAGERTSVGKPVLGCPARPYRALAERTVS
jgi:hypothetical protein